MTTTVMQAAGTALCPKFELNFTGTKDKAALELLDAKIQAFSDGYNCESTITLDTLFHAGAQGPAGTATGNLNLMYGAGLTDVLAASGAYYSGIGWDGSGNNVIVPMMNFIDGTDGIDAAIKTATGFKATDFKEDMTGGTDGYGYEVGAPSATLILAEAVGTWTTVGTSLTQSFYMPTAVTGTAEGSTSKTGDRFEADETLSFYTSGDATTRSVTTFMNDKCASGVAVVMGAAAVAMTGVAAIASTLAI